MPESVYKPELLRLSVPAQRQRYIELLGPGNVTIVHDTIHLQLAELIKNRQPGKPLTPGEIATLVAEKLGETDAANYGVWAYYPWSHRLVHLLDENEFAELRTLRNHYKINHDEELVLASKKICVIGLSVGQSVALTLAMERSFGELRLADYDKLDLSNLNRLRAGVHEIGDAKTVICARAIAEIDPYLKVVLYHEGIAAENIDSFYNENGKADLIIEECDSIDIKILSRLKAREYGIPVMMETSDRGMIDIERFDLDPQRMIFHGLAGELNMEGLKALEAGDRLKLLVSIAGADSLSDRMKLSMTEMNRTIMGWPQLASAVTMGGGVAADISRKILLGTHTDSGRFYVDLDNIVCNAT